MSVTPKWKNGRMKFTNETNGRVMNGTVDSLSLLTQVTSMQQAAFFASKDLARELLRLRRENIQLKKLLASRTRSLTGASAAAKARLNLLNDLKAKSLRAKVKGRKPAPKAKPAKKGKPKSDDAYCARTRGQVAVSSKKVAVSSKKVAVSSKKVAVSSK